MARDGEGCGVQVSNISTSDDGEAGLVWGDSRIIIEDS